MPPYTRYGYAGRRYTSSLPEMRESIVRVDMKATTKKACKGWLLQVPLYSEMAVATMHRGPQGKVVYHVVTR